MENKVKIDANGIQVEVLYGGTSGDFISITDIAKYKTSEILSITSNSRQLKKKQD